MSEQDEQLQEAHQRAKQNLAAAFMRVMQQPTLANWQHLHVLMFGHGFEVIVGGKAVDPTTEEAKE